MLLFLFCCCFCFVVVFVLFCCFGIKARVTVGSQYYESLPFRTILIFFLTNHCTTWKSV